MIERGLRLRSRRSGSPRVFAAMILIPVITIGVLVACTKSPVANSSVESEAALPKSAPSTTRDETTVAIPTTSAPSEEQIGVASLAYPVVDTGQVIFYSNHDEIAPPMEGDPFWGQDATRVSYEPAYVDNGDGTVSDLNTGLMWQQDPGEKVIYAEALEVATDFDLAGYEDWRLPTIKELYSLILFSGVDPSGCDDTGVCELTPFIDTEAFVFQHGDESIGERIIDSQYASATRYSATTMDGDETVFGVNFADGRIKGYGLEAPGGGEMTFFVLFVRGNPEYGVNDLLDKGNGTVADRATGLLWSQADSREPLSWQEALAYCQDLEFTDRQDWQLPDAKELQSIVDYTRSPLTTGAAAIDPVFEISSIVDEGGGINYPFYWTATTHANSHNGSAAVYLAFGEALGWMSEPGGGPEGGQGGLPTPGKPPDFSVVAETLGVPLEELLAALGGPPPDLTATAEVLGISVARLQAALPTPTGENAAGVASQSQSAREPRLLDVHGAGSQRSDPKVGDPVEFPLGRGPQGDVIRIFNYARCVTTI